MWPRHINQNETIEANINNEQIDSNNNNKINIEGESQEHTALCSNNVIVFFFSALVI